MIQSLIQMANSSKERKIKVRATKQGALYIDVTELFSLPKVQRIVEKALLVPVVGQKQNPAKH